MAEPNKAVSSRRSFLVRTCLAALCAAPIFGGLTVGATPASAAILGHKGPAVPKVGHHGKVKVPKTKAKGGHIKKKIQKHKMAKAPLG